MVGGGWRVLRTSLAAGSSTAELAVEAFGLSDAPHTERIESFGEEEAAKVRKVIAEAQQGLDTLGKLSPVEGAETFADFVEGVTQLRRAIPKKAEVPLSHLDSLSDFIMQTNSTMYIINDEVAKYEWLVSEWTPKTDREEAEREETLASLHALLGLIQLAIQNAIILDQLSEKARAFQKSLHKLESEMAEIEHLMRSAVREVLRHPNELRATAYCESRHPALIGSKISECLWELGNMDPVCEGWAAVLEECKSNLHAIVAECGKAERVLSNPLSSGMSEDTAQWVRRLRVECKKSYTEVARKVATADYQRERDGEVSDSLGPALAATLYKGRVRATGVDGLLVCLAARTALRQLAPHRDAEWAQEGVIGRYVAEHFHGAAV